MPPAEKVLLRKSTEGIWTEVGVLVERLRGKTWRLTLHDGSEVEHDIQASESYADRGSLAYRLKVDPESVVSDLESRPDQVFLLALTAFPKGAKAAKLKQAFVGVDRGVVDRAWVRAKKRMDSSPAIDRSDEKVPTYALVTETAEEGATGDYANDRGSTPKTTVTVTPVDSTSAAPPAPPPQPAAPIDGEELRTDADRRPGAAASPAADPLKAALREQGWDEADAEMAARGKLPLKLGQALGRLKASDLAALLETLQDSQRVDVAIALGHGKEKVLEREVSRVSQPMYEAALRRGRGEVAADAANGALLTALSSLTERASTSFTLSLALAADLAGTFAKAAGGGDQRTGTRAQARVGLNKSLEAAAGAIEGQGVSSKHGGADLARLAKAARHVPFSRTGGRSLLVATLYRKEPGQARADDWWQGATFDELSEAGHGPLARVLEDGSVAEKVVRPLMVAAIEEAQSRSRLGQIIASPAPLARWVPGDKLQEAILRAGARDQVASTWAEVLSDHHELERMQGELERARQETEDSIGKQHQLQQRVADLEKRIATVGEELAAARSTQGETRGVHERQVRADLVRVLARVAAQVSQSAAASEDVGLMRSVSHAVAREGLEPIGEVERRSTYDPVLHDPMGQSISADSQVTVVRPGYTWRDGRDTVVLLKAQVVPTGE